MTRGAFNYASDKLQRGEPHSTKLYYKITGTTTVTKLEANASLVGFGAITDAAVAAFLGETASPFVAAAFDATAMGTGMFGGVIDFGGQVRELIGVCTKIHHATMATDAAMSTGSEALSDLTASTAATECAVKNGNVGFRALVTGLDALTAGIIEVEVIWRSK